MTEVIEKLGGLSNPAADLRQAFDQAFADPATIAEEAGELVLAVRDGTNQYGVRMSEIAGVHRCPRIVPLPRLKPACLGIIGIRGNLHAAFHLGVLLGGAPKAANAPRWLVLAPGRDAPAFAFDAIDACLTMKPEEVREVGQAGEMNVRPHSLFVRDGTVRQLLHLPTLVALAIGSEKHSSSDESSR